MSADETAPELSMDPSALYREETFTDRRAGTIRRLTPVTADGDLDTGRPVLYVGQAQLLTPMGTIPLVFELEAASMSEAVEKFPEAANQAMERAMDELKELRREAASSIVVPQGGGDFGGPGGGAGGGFGGGGGIQMP